MAGSPFAKSYLEILLADTDVSQAPLAAADAIVDGMESQALFELAGMSQADDVGDLIAALERAAEELGLGSGRDSASRHALVETVLVQIAAGSIPPRDGGIMIWTADNRFGGIESARADVDDVITLTALWDDEPHQQDEITSMIREIARAAYVSSNPQGDSSPDYPDSPGEADARDLTRAIAGLSPEFGLALRDHQSSLKHSEKIVPFVYFRNLGPQLERKLGHDPFRAQAIEIFTAAWERDVPMTRSLITSFVLREIRWGSRLYFALSPTLRQAHTQMRKS